MEREKKKGGKLTISHRTWLVEPALVPAAFLVRPDGVLLVRACEDVTEYSGAVGAASALGIEVGKGITEGTFFLGGGGREGSQSSYPNHLKQSRVYK